MTGRVSFKAVQANRRNNAAIGNGRYEKAREFTKANRFFTCQTMAKALRIETVHANAICQDFLDSGEITVRSHVQTHLGKPTKIYTRAS